MANHQPIDMSPLTANEATIKKLWGLLLSRLDSILPTVGGEYSYDMSPLEGLRVDLSCRNFPDQRALRGRGGYVPIVPLFASRGEDIDYWISIYQNWRESPRPRIRSFLYHTTSLTVFFGSATSIEKLQLFRAEWPGIRMRPDGELEFESPGAGHPHWQFDVYQSRANQVEVERQRLAELGRALEEIVEVEEFGEMVVEELNNDELSERDMSMERLSRMHFAQHAAWSVNPWEGNVMVTASHARCPMEIKEILNWTLSTVIYIQNELKR
jgi:hypothetical protein